MFAHEQDCVSNSNKYFPQCEHIETGSGGFENFISWLRFIKFTGMIGVQSHSRYLYDWIIFKININFRYNTI